MSAGPYWPKISAWVAGNRRAEGPCADREAKVPSGRFAPIAGTSRLLPTNHQSRWTCVRRAEGVPGALKSLYHEGVPLDFS